MSIQDLSGNQFATQTIPMIGFVPAAADPNALSLRIYPFLIEVIREADQNEGNQFVERFLEGPQQMWGSIDERIKALPSLWSVTDIEDRFLIYLKWIVGWTSELDHVTDDLDSATLRRLIAASVPFWKIRGTEDSMVDILQLTTAARLRVWNWFDLRWILGETGMGEDHMGYDPWMLSLPGPPNYDEYRMNVRIVDDGTLNRRLVRNLVRLTRPAGERVTISYIGFLDQFIVDDDDSQWSHNGLGTTTVANGFMRLGNQEDAVASVPGADDWLNYTWTSRVRGNGDVQAYRTASTDYYFVTFDVTGNAMELGYYLAGVPTVLATVNMEVAFGSFLSADLYYAIRVEVMPEAGQTRIRVFWEANPVFSVLDPTHAQGSIGFASLAGEAFDVSDVEVFFNPLEADIIDINS